jgi:hypothetical protein
MALRQVSPILLTALTTVVPLLPLLAVRLLAVQLLAVQLLAVQLLAVQLLAVQLLAVQLVVSPVDAVVALLSSLF